MDKYVIDLDKVLDELELNDKYDESNNYDPNDSRHDPNAVVSSAHFNDSIVSLMNLNEKIDMKDADFSIHVKPPKLLTNINNNDSSINNFHAGNLNILMKHNNDNNGNIQNVDNVQQQQQQSNSNLSNDMSSLSNLIRTTTTTTTTTTTSHDTFIDAKNTDVTINQCFSSNNDDHMQNNQSNLEFSYVHNNNSSSSEQTSVIEDVSSNNNISIVSDSNEAFNVDDKNTNNNVVIIREDKCDIDADQLVDNKTVVSDVPDEKSCDNSNEIVKDSTNLDLNDDERPQESIIIAKTCAFIEENQLTAENVDLEINDNENQTIPISEPEVPTETTVSKTELDDVLKEKTEIVTGEDSHLDEDTIGNMNEEDLDKYLGDLNNDLENLELQTEKIIGIPGDEVTEPTAVCHQIVEQNCVNNSEQTKTLLAVTNTSNGMQTVNDEGENFEQIETAVPIDTADAQSEYEQNETCGSSNEPIQANENDDTDAQLKELEELLTAANASNNNNNNNQNSENRGGLVQNITYFERQEMPHGLTEEEQMLGKVKPFWIPDEDAQNCLHCDVKFTMIKRRHHCRSCGKVLCSQCCNFKAKLPYLEYKEARVCQLCYGILMRIEEIERINGHQIDISNAISNLNQSLEARSNSHHNHNNNNVAIPDPNNPSEYCSTIPPLEQVNEAVQLPPPTVMVPIGVLKRPGTSNMRRSNTSPESSNNGERAETVKQVMFSDGVRPGGDLVEPQPSTARLPADEQKPMIRTQLQLKSPLAEKILVPFENITKRIKMTRLTVVDNNGVSLPPIINYNELKSVDPSLPSKPNYQQLVELLKNPLMPCVTFGLTKNLHINAKIISKTCCNSKECWSFFSKGLASSGQDEILLVLDCESLKRSSTVPDGQPQQQQTSDKNPSQDDLRSDPVILDNYDFPRDVFRLYTTIYDSASSATLYLDLTHIFFPDGLFNNKENSGFIFTRPTLQCFQNINVPAPPFLIAILIHKWEIPWAKVFPLRLVLRLGYEYKMYPSPVISYANRKSTYFEIGHTIMNVLADFRNFHYTLSVVKDLFICVEDRKRVNLLIPKLSYEKVCKVLSTSNEHVLAFGGNLSLKCDSHFVCIQNEDEDDSQYHTQLFSYPDSPQKLTGASFIVFSGALKSSTGLKAKMNIVEDGLLVQIPPTMMEELRSAIKDMKDLKIDCCKVTENDSPVEAYVHLQWVNDELSTNLGVRSQIDGLNLEGVQSARIFSNPDYANERYLIRWIEVFLLQINENSRRSEMINANRLAESVAQAFCVALIDYLDQLYENGLTKISLRISLDVDKVGYETGSGGKPLPTQITQPLDNALIPVIMENISTTGIEDPLVIELLFFVLLK